MKKWINLTVALLAVAEFLIISNIFWHKCANDRTEISQMYVQITQIKQNINDILTKKASVDAMYTYEQCTLFLSDIEDYKSIHKNASTAEIIKKVQEYKNLILEIERHGFTYNLEKNIYDLKKHFDVINIETSATVIDFNDNLEKFSNSVVNLTE